MLYLFITDYYIVVYVVNNSLLRQGVIIMTTTKIRATKQRTREYVRKMMRRRARNS